jgi:enoyl-CoA hydratase/3-hydroxyacyl-CoA dehydrogenase
LNCRGLTITTDGALATICLDSGPEKYLGELLLGQLAQCFSELDEDRTIETICVSGQPDAFLVGVDLPFFVRCLLANELDRILSFTRAAHGLLNQIVRSDKRVVAWVRGPAFGAGLEIALACHRIVASPTARFAFPETGFGIYPGMGGTQRTPRRIGVELAKWLIYTGAIVPPDHALEIGLIDAVHPTAANASQALEALQPPGASRLPESARFRALQMLFAQHDVQALRDTSLPLPADPQAVRAVVQLRGKAPVALELVEQVINRGMSLPLAEAIEDEFAHLRQVFSTEDARTGLASIGKARPTFVGR